MKRISLLSILILVLVPVLCQCSPESRSSLPPMKKHVTEQAGFVLYMPPDWKAQEREQGGFKTLVMEDPSGRYSASLFYGMSPAGRDVLRLAGLLAGEVGKRFPDLAISGAMASPKKDKVVFDGTFTDSRKLKKEFRAWVSGGDGSFTSSSIEAPQGKLAESKQLLITILSNVRIMKRAFQTGPSPVKISLVQRRLSDGSATLKIPSDWKYQDFGKGAFIAKDPTGLSSFMVGSTELLTSKVGVRVPNVIVSNYLPPHQALQMIAGKRGMATNMKFLQVSPRQDLNQQLSRAYKGAPATAEEFVYLFDAQGRRFKGFSFGISFGSRLGTDWRFWHTTVAAPLEQFDALLPVFVSMVQSYAINDQFAMNYIAQGIARLRQMQEQTSRIVSRNAQDIHQMMQAAYDERQKSMDYIDYQRTNSIRGQSDWVSSMEGGAVHHSDSWGTKNTATGEYHGGQPYNYVNFTGKNPKYNEQMQEINNRALYEAYKK
jgi:hypothetical protein